MPLSKWAIIVAVKSPSHVAYFSNNYGGWIILTILVLVMNLVAIPYYFYKSIIWALPEVNDFDSSGFI